MGVNIDKKIIKLVIRFLFYSSITFWSFCVVNILQTANSDKSIQDNEAYLTPSGCDFSFFSGSENTNVRYFYSGKYIKISSVKLFKIKRHRHYIQSGSPSILTNYFIFCDYTRPPPVLDSLSILSI